MSESALFAAKNCLVLGATHRIGRTLCSRLSAQGGFVVAVDADEAGLMQLAEACPERIAPLALKSDDAEGLARLTRNWGPDPLHLLVMVHPLHGSTGLEHVLNSVRDTTRALAPILEASNGAAVLLFAEATAEDMLGRARSQALASLTRDLAAEGARINALALHPAALSRRVAGKVGTAAMMMALPMSAAIGGAVLPVGQNGMGN